MKDFKLEKVDCATKLKKGLYVMAGLHFNAKTAYITIVCGGKKLPLQENDGGRTSTRFQFKIDSSHFKHETDCSELIEFLGNNTPVEEYLLKKCLEGLSLEVRKGKLWASVKVGGSVSDWREGGAQPDFCD
jgi:hypothetical protein